MTLLVADALPETCISPRKTLMENVVQQEF
jgi:hypothetical protein